MTLTATRSQLGQHPAELQLHERSGYRAAAGHARRLYNSGVAFAPPPYPLWHDRSSPQTRRGGGSMGHGALIGRQAELDVLAGWLTAALGADQRLVLCVGEPGVGKTRLAEELIELARERLVPVVWGRVADADGVPPFWLWRQVLRGCAAISDIARIATELGVVSDLALIAPETMSGLETVPVDDPDGGSERRFRLFDAVTRVLREVAVERGLVVVLDDVHWADPPSLLLLLHVARDLTPCRLLVLATCRDNEPTVQPLLVELIREPMTSRLELGGLSAGEVRRQLQAVSGVPVPPELSDRIYQLTSGNPFFVGELARALDSAAIPDTIRVAIRRRMDRVSPRCRHQLRAGSVVGREFSIAVVASMIGQPVLSCLGAVDEAVAARLIEPALAEGEHRFAHALIRDAIEADLPAEDRVGLHRAAAEALEQFHAGRLEQHLSELAGHWAAAAVAGDRITAARWSERAADEASHRLAYEEAARLYQLALDIGADELEPLHRCSLELCLARALQQSAELNRTRDACHRAAALARDLGRPDLLAEAALVMEPVVTASWDRALGELCSEALAHLGPEPTAVRARLLARLAETGVYIDNPDDGAARSLDALSVAEQCGEPAAIIAALRARQLVRSGPDGVTEREALADRLLTIGRVHRSPIAELQAHNWRTDVHFARGDLIGVAAEVEELAWCVNEVGGPLSRWQLLRYRGALAQARGDFANARRYCDAASATIAPIRHPAAFPLRMQLLTTINRHIGVDPDAEHIVEVVRAARPGHGFRVMDYLGPALMLAEAGHVEEAAARFRAAGPVSTWRTPPFFRVPLYAMSVLVAIRVDAAASEVAALRAILAAHRGRHVVPETDVTFYLGPVELYLGKAAGYLGNLDDATADLDAAIERSRNSGAAGFLVEAQSELATVLVRRGDPADLRRARSLLASARPDAAALGMAPFCDHLTQLAERLDERGSWSPLTRREAEVGACVARGLSNRQIAAELHITERTAGNHIQHILTKLGFVNRSQIAVWITETPGSTTDRRRNMSSASE